MTSFSPGDKGGLSRRARPDPWRGLGGRRTLASALATVGVQVVLKVATLTFEAIRVILDENEALAPPAPGPTLPSSIVRTLHAALRGTAIEGDSYRVVLITEDAATLVAWCREVAPQASPADAAVLRLAAVAIELAP